MNQTVWKTFTLLLVIPIAAFAEPLSGTKPLEMEGDLSAQMVAGIDRFLNKEIDTSVMKRTGLWDRDFSSREAYEKSVAANRERFRAYIGAVDRRPDKPDLEFVGSFSTPAKIAETEKFTVHTVRWRAFGDVYGEGLLLDPKAKAKARVVAIPDADQTPEMLVGLAPGVAAESQFARRLAENGCQVIVPVLIDRKDTWSGNPAIRMTNQPHREWVYRQAFQMGRHVIGYEVNRVLAAVDWFASVTSEANLPIQVAGYGEGGLIAFYAAALDTRISRCLVSGYFGPRESVWQEPIYRNVFALLTEFGDAEIATRLVYPRQVIVEHSEHPKIDGPPAAKDGRSGAAPGAIRTPSLDAVQREVSRQPIPSAEILPESNITLVAGENGPIPFGSEKAVAALLRSKEPSPALLSDTLPKDIRSEQARDPAPRQRHQIEQLVEHTQKLLRLSEHARRDFWKNGQPTTNIEAWKKASEPYRRNLWEEVIGRLPDPSLPANARTRKIIDRPTHTGYEVVLDVWPEVYAWGYLLVPKDIKPGEQRPVVVCQHGLEGVPHDAVTDNPKDDGFKYYSGFATKLAERGFVTYAPHNPYRGQDKFRVLQRKANPLKKSLFSVIIGQHQQTLGWLSSLPFVDRKRIGFYGLSYGGKTAMRVPAILEDYALSICSADFNEWVKKNVTVDDRYSYMFTGEYEMFEFNLGHTFNYAEMGYLIAPRPFMVERGHNDGVAPDEWVAYEYAKIRRLFAYLGIPERTTIEFFNGPHSIHGVGTYAFLHQHLNWPAPQK